MKKVTVNGTVVLHQHYLYRGYLQIAALDLTRSNAPALWFLHWDPTQPVATRLLSLRKNGTWYTYGHDLTKNVTELYKADGTIATAYDYTPYGSVTASGIDQPIQWSSEHYDAELALVYYNYRHYNPLDGRWINLDPIAEEGGYNLYGFVGNMVIGLYDVLGLSIGINCSDEFGSQSNRADPLNFQGVINSTIKKMGNLCGCLEELSMVLHGNPTCSVFGPGSSDNIIRNSSEDPQLANMINEQNAFSLFQQLKTAIEPYGGFCESCKIFYISCNTGLSTFVQKIADATGCEVYAPKGYSSGTHKSKQNSRITRTAKIRDPKTGEKIMLPDISNLSQNGEQAEDHMFRVYVPHHPEQARNEMRDFPWYYFKF